MQRGSRVLLGFVGALALMLMVSAVWAGEQAKAPEKKVNIVLPLAVAKAVKENRPNAVIDKMTVEIEAGIVLYDIEFKAGQGEIEVAKDGTVMDVATIVEMKDIPQAAAAAIQKAAVGARITQLERSEVRAEIQKVGEKGKLVVLASPKYVYEAELEKGNQTGEVQVAPDGKIVEATKWTTKGAKEEEEKDKP